MIETFFEVRSIGPDSLRRSYAVMALGHPALSFSAFRKLVGATRSGNLAGLFDRRGYVHAVFRTRVERMPEGSRRLHVFDLVTSDGLLDSFASQMVQSLMRAARAQGCDQLTVLSPAPRSSNGNLAEILDRLGFSNDSVLMARQL